jgi:hypothetical protein
MSIEMFFWPLILLLCSGMFKYVMGAEVDSLTGKSVEASDHEERLMVEVFRGYNSLIQPIKHSNDTPLTVKIALQLVLLINVVGSFKNRQLTYIFSKLNCRTKKTRLFTQTVSS